MSQDKLALGNATQMTKALIIYLEIAARILKKANKSPNFQAHNRWPRKVINRAFQ